MPELPEVETVRRGLEPILTGAAVENVVLRRPDLRAPFPAGFAQALEKSKVIRLRRRAKYILADLDNGHVWLSHLGMSGSFRLLAPGEAPGIHDHVVLGVRPARPKSTVLHLVFNDPRRFGQMDVFPAAAEASHPALASLGPEPLGNDFSGPVLAQRLAGKNVAIKIALLDQKVVAGVGNIYASEALFAAGIDPRKRAGAIKGAKADALAASIRAVLQAAIISGGSTLRDHRQLDGSTGYFQHSFAVYDREGQVCTQCTCGGKKAIRAIVQGGRSTFFCPVKQR